MLVLRLVPSSSQNTVQQCLLEWCWHDPSSDIIDSPSPQIQRKPLDELACSDFEGRDLEDATLWWPAEWSLSVTTTVTAQQQRELLRKPAFELEPFVGQDIEDLHVSCAPTGNTGLALVGVDAKALATVLDRLHELGVDPKYIGLDTEVIASMSTAVNSTLFLMPLPGRVLVYWAGQLSMALQTSMLPQILDQLKATLSSQNWPTLCVPKCSEVTCQDTLQSLLTSWSNDGGDVKSVALGATSPSNWWWSQAAVSLPVVNLRQGEFERSSYWTQLRHWRPAWGSGLVACLLLWLMYVGMTHYVERQTLALRKEQTAVYQSYYPNANQIFDPPAQLRSKLARHASPQSTVDGLKTYGEFVESFIALHPSTRGQLARVAFTVKQRELTVQLTVNDIETLESLNQALNQKGLVSSIDSARDSAAGVAAQLRIDLADAT